jgi:6-phosphogluconolactonase
MPPFPHGVVLHVCDDSESLLGACAAHIAARLDMARAVALTGGNTARGLYAALARHPHGAHWKEIHWFWGDDRLVPQDHPDSNVGMTIASLLRPLEAAYVHAIPTASSAQVAAQTYAATLQGFYGSDRLDPANPLFDLVLLVLGADGHVASLLPQSPALARTAHWTAATEGRDHPRVTLTYPVLESAREVVMVASGAAKHAALADWFAGDAALPVTALRPACGITLFADAAALAHPALSELT